MNSSVTCFPAGWDILRMRMWGNFNIFMIKYHIMTIITQHDEYILRQLRLLTFDIYSGIANSHVYTYWYVCMYVRVYKS